MRQKIEISLSPEECESENSVAFFAAKYSGISDITSVTILRKSLDARKHPVRYNLLLELYIQETASEPANEFVFQDVRNKPEAVIIGAGPAGIFAALKLIEHGIKPIIYERGKDVKNRRRDLAGITRFNTVNPESNYCFGEGGAGTYSDGKLYTRSTKRGNVQRILNLFIYHGAEPSIRFEAHPHIGTNKLPAIITRMRETILTCGGEIHFESKLTDIHIDRGEIKAVVINDHIIHNTRTVLLATGHSARDIFELLHHKGVALEAKPFALGVRIEHPQELIDKAQYKCDVRGPYLPPAAYALVNQSLGRGVFSFCMCPGGIIAPAATHPGEVVVNGWSPSKRNNAYANSGLVVSIEPKDFQSYAPFGPLAAMHFQRAVEQSCFQATQSLQAPAQRIADFVARKASSSLPDCSYLPGIQPHNLDSILPQFVVASLRHALSVFGKKIKGYVSNDGVLVATESRTSSPVRIPRDKITLQHIQIKGLFPCAEGAGYAGGIVSAAMDGERCADAIAVSISQL